MGEGGRKRAGNTDTLLEACACFNVRNAARLITDLYDRTLEPAGLRTTQLATLVAIEGGGGVTMQSLATALGLDPSTMTRTLRPLENDGLVCVAAGDDRRAKELELTREGRAKLRRCLKLWERAQASLRESVGSDLFDRMIADLGTLSQALRH